MAPVIALALWCFLLTLCLLYILVMLGELARQAGFGAENSPGSAVLHEKLESATGASVPELPASWPMLPQDPDGNSLLLVLSSTCATCTKMAQDASVLRDILPDNASVIVSAPTESRAAPIMANLTASLSAVQLDVAGTWLRSMNIDSSPALVHIREGVVREAVLFASIDSLDELVRRSNPERSVS